MSGYRLFLCQIDCHLRESRGLFCLMCRFSPLFVDFLPPVLVHFFSSSREKTAPSRAVGRGMKGHLVMHPAPFAGVSCPSHRSLLPYLLKSRTVCRRVSIDSLVRGAGEWLGDSTIMQERLLLSPHNSLDEAKMPKRRLAENDVLAHCVTNRAVLVSLWFSGRGH